MPYVSSHNTEIYYESHGESRGDGARVLVFAHGMGGNAAIWFNQLAYFLKDYRIITFDHRYFARSTCDKELFQPAWFPDDIMAVLDKEKIASANFICQSLGGWTGSQMAIHHPERVDSLIMSHTPGVFTNQKAINDPAEVGRLVSKPMSAFGSAALAADYSEKNLAGAILYSQISSFNGIDPSHIPRQIGKAALGVDTDSLKDYSIPTLFISADHDILFPSEYIKALASTLPGATFVNLGDAGHSSYFELPLAFNKTLQAFLEKQVSSH